MFGIDKDKIKEAFAEFENDLALIEVGPASPNNDHLAERVANIEKFITSLKDAFS